VEKPIAGFIRRGAGAMSILGLVIASLLSAPVFAAGGEVEWLPMKTAYNRAMKENKPLVVYLTKPSCPWCRRLEKEVLSSEQFNALADQAIFSKADPREDKTAGRIANSLEIEGYPTVSVLRATKESLEEAGRVAGYFPLDDFMARIEHHLRAWHGGSASDGE
jgi:thioredoxin-related protein